LNWFKLALLSWLRSRSSAPLNWFKDSHAPAFPQSRHRHRPEAIRMSLLNEPLQFAPQLRPGRVTLVGAGPGDPELLTLKAARALREARLVLYDHLVGKDVLDLAPRDADRIYVGKESGCHTLTQEGIIDLMIRLARSGRPVLRLKGGDPYIFGRGGEEAQALAAHGIPYDVIPGISAAQGAAACVGVPLTHRDHAHTLIYATGHGCASKAGDAELDWPTLARPHQTVVIYMGVASLPAICARLIAHGAPPTTPAAVIERATLPHDVKPPALIMIGSVVGLHAQFNSGCTVPHALEASDAMR
jgi:uroporphyrin-III C-methyltransferase